MNTPKRIWAVHRETLGAVMTGEWADSIRHLGGTEYILAAEHDRLMAEKDAEIAAAERRAYERAAEVAENFDGFGIGAAHWPWYIAAAIREMKDDA